MERAVEIHPEIHQEGQDLRHRRHDLASPGCADRERAQAYEGVVIAKSNRGLNSSFTVRKISHGEGVERTFQTHSPSISEVEVKRRGSVRRAKLYYLRDLSGKAARIEEKV